MQGANNNSDYEAEADMHSTIMLFEDGNYDFEYEIVDDGYAVMDMLAFL